MQKNMSALLEQQQTRTTLAANVRRLMSMRGWSQLELSKQSGISYSSLSLFMRGLRGINDVSIDRLAAAFGVSLSELFAD